MHPPDEFGAVLRFWFPDLSSADHERMVRQFEWWFRGGADSGVKERFPLLFDRAARGELDDWSQSPRSRLALVLDGIETGHYAALATPWEKTFFFLPLVHSEELSYLERAVELAEQLLEQAAPEFRRILGHSASQARGHRDVIARFGRHPHRNAVLGRPSTPDELDYLASGQLVHTRLPPR